MTHNIKYYMSDTHRSHYPKNTNFLKEKDLSTTIVKQGIILPAHTSANGGAWADGGVVDKDGNFIEASKTGTIFGGPYDYNKEDIQTIDEEVVFFGPFVEHWGHFICDQISRLWYIKDNPTKYKIAYCGWAWNNGPGDLHGNFLELLELLGCKKSQLINIQKPTKFKKVIIPDLSFQREEFYTPEFEGLTDIITKNALKNKIKAPEKVYFSRCKFAGNKERGEDKVEQAFHANGYKVVYPEELSLKEQITYLNKSKNIAMVAGSISHSLMFAKSNKVNVAILNKFSLVNNYQIVIDNMTNANISYVDCYFQPLPVLFGVGPFLIKATKYLKKYFRDNNLSIGNIKKPTLRNYAWFAKNYYTMYRTPGYKEQIKSQQKAWAEKKNFEKS